MIDFVKMWVFGLPYALWETQRIKVAVSRLDPEFLYPGETIYGFAIPVRDISEVFKKKMEHLDGYPWN